jgi:serine/threonine protein kinase
MRKKYPVPFTHKFRNADPLALRLLERLLAFDPKDRPTAEEVNSSEHAFFSFVRFALTVFIKRCHTYILIFDTIYYFILFQALADPYFASLANVEREPSRHPISKLEFEFERRKLAKDDVRELIYREVGSNSF